MCAIFFCHFLKTFPGARPFDIYSPLLYTFFKQNQVFCKKITGYCVFSQFVVQCTGMKGGAVLGKILRYLKHYKIEAALGPLFKMLEALLSCLSPWS